MFRIFVNVAIAGYHHWQVSSLIVLIGLGLAIAPANAQIVVLDNETYLAKQVSFGPNAQNISHTITNVAQAEGLSAPQNPRTLWIALHFNTCLADEASAIVRHLKQGSALFTFGQ